MKVLLIYPPYRHGRSILPKGLAYVAACLQKAGHQLDVLDTDVYIHTEKQLEETLGVRDYEVVGISAMAPAYSFVLKVSDIIKRLKPSVKIMVGGHLATYSYDILMKNSPVDFCVIGEGEITSLELLQALSGERDIDSVDGIVYKKGGVLVRTKTRRLIDDLDSIPFPAWDLFAAEEVYCKTMVIDNIFKAGRHFYISGTRGCPYACTFCSYQTKVRMRSVGNMTEELKYLKRRYRITSFSFEDNLFMVNKDRTMEFCKRLIEEGLNLCWRTAGRVNVVDKEVLAMMKRSGCFFISYGIESGSQRMLERMKKHSSPELIERAIRLTREAGIWPGGTWILGMPGEDDESVRESIKLYKKINRYRNFCNVFFFATPYPGTELYNEVKAKGRIPDEHTYMMKISRAGDAFEFVVNCTDNFSDKELMEMKKEVEREVRKDFYTKHPLYWIADTLGLPTLKRAIIYVKIRGLLKFIRRLVVKSKICKPTTEEAMLN